MAISKTFRWNTMKNSAFASILHISIQERLDILFHNHCVKGQLISEWNFGVFKSSNNSTLLN